MYGVVILMAMSSSAEAPDFGKRGCHGCSGGVHMPGAGVHGSLYMPEAISTPTVDATPAQPGAAPATIVVTLSAAGQLNIDGYTVPVASDRHTYVTLPINPGESRSVTL